jgi:hypothetical protein
LKRPLVIALAIYSLWAAFCIWVTIKPIGDGGVTAHLWLTITGFPTALLSWLLPHGSLVAVVLAGVLGAAQLLALVGFIRKRKRVT